MPLSLLFESIVVSLLSLLVRHAIGAWRCILKMAIAQTGLHRVLSPPTTLTTPRVKDKSGSKRCLSANGNSVYLIDTLSKVPTYLFFATAFRPAVQPHPASIVNK